MKRRQRRPDKARDGTRLRVGPRKRTVRYVEEAEGYPLAGRATPAGPDDFFTALR